MINIAFSGKSAIFDLCILRSSWIDTNVGSGLRPNAVKGRIDAGLASDIFAKMRAIEPRPVPRIIYGWQYG